MPQQRMRDSMEIFELIKKIKPKTWVKSIWWLVLVILLICFLFPRIGYIQNGNAQPFDIFLFLVLISLLLIPLFQEVELFGIKLKKELEDIKENINVRFNSLSAEIKNTISVSPTINFPLPTDEGINEFKQKYRDSITTTGADIETAIDVPNDNIYLFKIRYAIENQLRRIIQKNKSGYEPIHAYNLSILLSDLFSYQIISGEEASALRDIIAICNFGIHDKPITTTQVNFVKEIGEKFINKLKTY